MSFVFRRIREVGGVKNAFNMLWKTGDVRAGTLVGEDQFGNKYYENNEYFIGRHRWVDYSSKDSDGSHVPPEWHRWIHCMTDNTPVIEPPEPQKFHQDHIESKTGTNEEYVPYSTTRPKIQSWQPN